MKKNLHIEILSQALRLELRLKLIAAITNLLIGLVLFLYAGFWGLSFGALFFTIGIYLGFKTVSNWSIENSQLIFLLQYDPQKIVWVYTSITQRMPFGLAFSKVGTIHFKMVNGEDISLFIPVKYLNHLSLLLSKHLTHATFGYTVDREQWFRAAPELLLKNERSTNVNKKDSF